MFRAGVRPGLALLAAAMVWVAAETGFAQRPPPGSPGSTRSTATTNTPAVSGTVVDAVTGRPLAGAVVSIGQGSQSSLGRQVTDHAGRFLFSNLDIMTTYELTASKPGYLDGALGSASVLPRAREVRLTLNEWESDGEIRLFRESALSGRLLDSDGEPLVGVHVVVLSRMVIAGEPRFVIGAGARTDDQGVYRISTLLPGAYVVMVPSVAASVPANTPLAERSGLTLDEIASARGAGGGASLHREAFVSGRTHLLLNRTQPPPLPSGPDGRPQGYTTTFYPGVRSLGAAKALVLGRGEDRRGVDVQLQPEPLFSVSGSLHAASRAPGSLKVFLMPRGSEHLGIGHATAATVSGADGGFTFLGVPRGQYTIRAGMIAAGYVDSLRGVSLNTITRETSSVANPAMLFHAVRRAMLVPSSQAGTAFSGRLAVEVTTADLIGVVIPVQRNVSIQGRLVHEGPLTAAAGRTVLAFPVSGDPMLGRPRGVTGGDAPTTFTIDGVIPGEYVLRAGYNVRSILWNGRDFTDTPLPIADHDVSGVVITTNTNRAGGVTGLVLDDQGLLAAPDATVICFPVEPARWRWAEVEFARLQSMPVWQNQGRYYFTSMPAGDYYLLAVAGQPPDEWQSAAFLERAALVATRVSLSSGGTRTETLRVVQVIP